jgi:hypothetical protein
VKKHSSTAGDNVLLFCYCMSFCGGLDLFCFEVTHTSAEIGAVVRSFTMSYPATSNLLIFTATAYMIVFSGYLIFKWMKDTAQES